MTSLTLLLLGVVLGALLQMRETRRQQEENGALREELKRLTASVVRDVPNLLEFTEPAQDKEQRMAFNQSHSVNNIGMYFSQGNGG